ncbi:DUF421 domain-containing protein [Dyadobacter sp. LJ53]|uniref:DUF421 domain-containing protein n=1 Tax=Dyadobacter chenwenxiniae TaxID=2906456 RepID=UPI001F1D4557|nr:YetF domain-containing protein [Dyadobacter chenwenxiniae]MCF0052609.1 DUF421 domain-containing protein [Dyadobacter chenwenxiniae]
MKPEDIRINDWQRIFVGDVPGAFYWEVILRVAVIYAILMISMRLMGKRMASQLSRNEMIAMVSLAAAIGIPLLSPDRGILPAFVIAIVVILIQQVTAWMATRNQKLESLTQGNISVLVHDHHLNLKDMRLTGITRERVFSQLRSNDILHLGEVKRLYFEAGGSFTIIRETEIVPGLGVLPDKDVEFQDQSYQREPIQVCDICGFPPADDSTDQPCGNCGSQHWAQAVSLK